MNNRELARLLRSAASALEHGRYQSANRKLNLIVREVYPQAEYVMRHSADWQNDSEVQS